jgi:hypothetical protein
MTTTLNPKAKRYLINAFKTLPQYEQGIVLQTIEHIATEASSDPIAEALSEAMAGRHFNKQERIQLEMDTLTRHFLHRRKLLETAFTSPQVSKILGISRQTPHDRLASQTLLGIKENGKLLFPSWQFDPTGPDGVLEGFPQVLKALAMSDYAKLNWLTRPNPYLEGLTPVEALKQGQSDRVIQQAEAAGASQWS